MIQVDDVSDLTFQKDMVVVTAGRSVGVVKFNGINFLCCVCDRPNCAHVNLMKEKKKNESNEDLPDYLQEMFSTQTEFVHSKIKQSLSRRRIPFDVNSPSTMRPPTEYLDNEKGSYLCEDTVIVCFSCGSKSIERTERTSIQDMVLYYKNYSFPCKGL